MSRAGLQSLVSRPYSKHAVTLDKIPWVAKVRLL